MKKTIWTFLIVIIFSSSTLAQIKYDYNWLFGYKSDADTILYGQNMSFKGDSISISKTYLNIDLGITNAMISDSTGQLLFYTNGCSISNYLGETMENGDSINPGEVHESQCQNTYTIPDGVLIIPKPGSDTEFYLFHQSLVFLTNPVFDIKTFPLYYSLVDMGFNNDLGKVITKNQILVEDTLFFGSLNAVMHTNGKDWWVIAPRESYGDIYSLLIKSDTIEGPFFQQINIGSFTNGEGGQSVFSPDGTKYIQYKIQDGIYLFDFDRNTGLLSNDLRIPFEEFTLPGGCAISSNSRFLYVNTALNLYQFDLEASDISASKTHIAEYDGYQSPFPTSFFLQQLAPDCRIYMNSPNGVDVLHVIKYPNRPGLDCEFIQHGLQFPQRFSISLPNFPHYRTGTPYPICDSTIVLNMTTPIFELPDPELLQLSVFPNPAKEQLTIRLTEPQQEPLSWRLYDALGREVLQQDIAPFAAEAEVSVEYLPRGIYFYGVEKDGVIVASGKVVVGH